MTHEDIIERAAESIMQRVNDTWPRTLNKDVLRDEIGKAIKEATKWKDWPPALSYFDGYLRQTALEDYFTKRKLQLLDEGAEQIGATDAAIKRLFQWDKSETNSVTASHDKMRAKLSNRLSDYKPE